ncbi:hypothetical protein BDZ45DRAFT_715343 [Acephala macrosclerotiorum]|nr:hypothetical protein BDZ45DRAFT_715343 [Acephala macrosclerotiorum]
MVQFRYGHKLGDSARELLEKYSKIPADEVESHVYSVRLKKGDQNFLDLGCCFGQELRKLASDGVPSEHLYGTDLRPEFFDLGYKLFRDKDLLKSRFIAADIFDPKSELHELDGKIDIIYAGSFLHLFDYKGQFNACKAIVKLLSEKKDSLLVGRQVGNLTAGERVHRTNKGQSMFRHNAGSFKKMWEDVGKETGTKWSVDVNEHLVEPGVRERRNWGEPELQRIGFAVFREV